MKSSEGYTNPMRSYERRLAPNFASREFRNPGLSGTGTNLGFSLHHTMPHLMRRSIKLQSGGMPFNPVGQTYAASRPNLYNPDPMHRRILALQQQMGTQFRNPNFTAFPGSTLGLPFAGGGAAPDPGELEEPEGDLSPQGQDDKQAMVEAMLALEGQHPHPEEAIERFVQIFGPKALGDLESIIQGRDRAGEGEEDDGEGDEEEEQQSQEPDQPDDLAAAGGGLLYGPGTGQSDEIEAETPSGHPVLLSDGEYVIDAPTVAALGDGSTNAGARRLDELRKRIRQDAYGNSKQAKPMRRGGETVLGAV